MRGGIPRVLGLDSFPSASDTSNPTVPYLLRAQYFRDFISSPMGIYGPKNVENLSHKGYVSPQALLDPH